MATKLSTRNKIIELRIYKLKPEKRDAFIQYFNEHLVPLNEKVGMNIMGQFKATDDPNIFIWMRGFPSVEDREKMKNAFYEGKDWKVKFEKEVMPMIEDYSNVYLMTPIDGSKIL